MASCHIVPTKYQHFLRKTLFFWPISFWPFVSFSCFHLHVMTLLLWFQIKSKKQILTFLIPFLIPSTLCSRSVDMCVSVCVCDTHTYTPIESENGNVTFFHFIYSVLVYSTSIANTVSLWSAKGSHTDTLTFCAHGHTATVFKSNVTFALWCSFLKASQPHRPLWINPESRIL